MPEIAGVDRKWWLIGGGGAVIVVYLVYRRQKKANAAAATTPDQSGLDPNTGLPYGTEGFGSAATGGAASGVTPSLYGYQDPTTGAFIGLGSSSQPATVLAPATNASWAQQTSVLMTQHGYDELTVDAAIGKYLAGMELTSDQLSIIQTAIGLEGLPPNPPAQPHTAPPPGQTTASPIAPGALPTPTLYKTGTYTVQWAPIPNALFYFILGNFLPVYVGSKTSYTGHKGMNVHLRAYPAGYLTSGYASGATRQYSVSAPSNEIRL